MPTVYSECFDAPLFKGKVSVNTGLFINGEYVDSVDGRTIEVLHPCTARPITNVATASRKDVDIAVEAATQAFRTSWGLRCAGSERGRLLHKLADLMEKNIDELTALEALDTGKNIGLIKQAEFSSTIGAIRYFAGWADKNSGKTIEVDDSKFAYTRHEPIGVVGVITPWNFPLTITCWKIAPCLATGNCLILKPSELTPLSALKLAEFAKEAGFPPGVFNVLPGRGPEAGQAIVEHPRVSKVAFTGSTLVGRKVMELAAKTNLKRVSLELGGKSPIIIFDDADLGKAVNSSLMAFYHSGQLCAAETRVFVQEGIHDKFLEQLVGAVRTLKRCDHPFGDPSEGIHTPIISKAQYERVMSYIESGKQAGAKVATGGERFGETGGWYIEPTVFTDVTRDMKIVQEEIFGPVIVLVKFKDEAEALKLANDSAFGLSSAIITENLSRAVRVANGLEAGSVFVNGSFSPMAQMPFGGVKQSGFGRDLGEDALHEYTTVKAVHVNIGVQM